jgi:iron complex outermembrane recepter protein
MKHERYARSTLALSAVLSLTPAQAQTQTPPAPNQTIVITGNPLGKEPGAQAASVLSGDTLARQRAASLGDTLDGLPGVAGSGFGPNSSRPVIRGLDGDRIKLLTNAGASIDASNLSFDHAPAIDPLIIERVEVLRGPAALLYGGNATGGVVNTLDNRIPRLLALQGLGGRAELRAGGAARERAGAAVLEGGAGNWAWHVDAYGRRAQDTRAPRYTPQEDGQALPASDTVRNSAARSSGGAVGAGWVSDRGFLGASRETMRQRYGVTAEPDVFIRMQRERSALAGELRGIAGPVQQVALQASNTRYQHEEVEGSGEVGTTFKSRGNDLRLEARQAPLRTGLGPLNGVWGLQTETLRFEALGEEAFVPTTHTRSQAVFALQALSVGATTLSAGARAEKVKVASDGDAVGSEEARFGSASSRRFSPLSLSLEVSTQLASGWSISANLGRTQRAPAYYELYANGVHVATRAYERGDPNLALERSQHAELGLAWRSGSHSLQAHMFNTRFANYIALDATGVDVSLDEESSVPEYAFRGVRARLRGFELEARSGFKAGSLPLELSLVLDTVRGDNLSTGEPLPRLPPLRLRVGLQTTWLATQWGVQVRRAAAQNRVPSTDTRTAGHTQLDLWASGQVPQLLGINLSWFAKLTNASNELATNAVAVQTVRGLSPAPARALAVGLRGGF